MREKQRSPQYETLEDWKKRWNKPSSELRREREGQNVVARNDGVYERLRGLLGTSGDQQRVQRYIILDEDYNGEVLLAGLNLGSERYKPSIDFKTTHDLEAAKELVDFSLHGSDDPDYLPPLLPYESSVSIYAPSYAARAEEHRVMAAIHRREAGALPVFGILKSVIIQRGINREIADFEQWLDICEEAQAVKH